MSFILEMKILMLGWEFPPFFAGGVGIVCYELTKALGKFEDLEIEYVMAYGPQDQKIGKNIKLKSAANKKTQLKNLSINKIDTLLYTYDNPLSYEERLEKLLELNENERKTIKDIYGQNLLHEVFLYSQRILHLYKNEKFDVIHAHDWTTIPAALLLKKATGKPIIFHVHITELDKTGGMGGHDEVFKIEKLGFEKADILIAVSNFVKNRLVKDYGINPDKIQVVHNGGISDLRQSLVSTSTLLPGTRVVMFAGRMTLQKGPEYFLHAARRVLEHEPNTVFLMIGSGDMLPKMMTLANDLGIGRNVLFHGEYTRDEADNFFERADVFVMPSVSEPFGIVPLEAVSKGTPTIISNQSGISEVLINSLKVDFWDTDNMAHKIISLLRYNNLHEHMKTLAYSELQFFNWDRPANQIHDLYRRFL